MNPDRWNQIQTLFKEVVELDHNSRETRLNKIYETDPDLYNELSSLLAADAEPSGLLDGFSIGSLDISDLLSMDGMRVGPFEIEQQIGSGGMGNVYLARRVSGGFEQNAALKLIKQGLSSEQILRRFENERSILARLQHPDIARLIDGGLTEDGMPWFGMEYVQGEPIDAYCTRLDLSVEERLRLFQRIASAVQYAHRNLVIHRDLKPANILVSVENGSPQIKLLDFGIARLLDDDSGNFMTQEGVRPMTRAYASPEQLTGEPVTTASDIYSLGVILYELLSGHLPFQPDNLTSNEYEQLILTGDPPKPSHVCTDRNRQKMIRGDLDMICLKALRTEPDRRYETVEQLSEDVRRHLVDLPVLARPESRAYLIRKFIGRHRSGATASGFIALSLLAGIAAFAWQYRIARQERDHARQEAATSGQVANFLQSLFEVADPAATNGDTLTARELLDRGAKQINKKLAGQPQVQARMYDVLGNVYLNLWRYSKADTMFSRALDIRRKVAKNDIPDIATSLYNIGLASIGIGKYDRADSVLSRALVLRRSEAGENDTLTAQALASLGLLKYKAGQYNLSLKYYQKAMAIYQSYPEEEQGKYVAQIKNDIGLIYYSKGNYELSATFIKQGLDYYMNHPDSSNREIISTDLGNLATTLIKMARYKEADSLFRESIRITRRLYGDKHPKTALKLNNYSTFLKNRERYVEAEKYQSEALDIFLKAYGPNHPYVAMCYNNMANLYDDQGDYKTALRYDQKSLELNKKIYGENGDLVANSYNNIGVVLLDLYRNKDAEEMFRAALRIDTITYGKSHPYVAMDYQAIGIALGAQGKVDEAERLIRYSISVFRKSEGDEGPETEIAKGELGRVLIMKGKYDEAMKLLRDALDHQEKTLPRNSWRLAEVKSLLGECLFKTGHVKEAEPLLTEGYRILLERKGKNYRYTRGAKERLVAYYRATGQLAKANEYRK